MKSLLSFIIRNSYVFLFIILEGLSVFMLVSYNNFQKNTFYQLYGDFSGTTNDWSHSVRSYFNLRVENQILLEENSKLRTKLDYRPSVILKSTTSDMDSSNIQKYIYHPAIVVRNSVSHRHNYLMINLGSNHGIKVDMAVVSEKGVVGIVKKVSANYATVLSVLNAKAYISAKHEKTHMEGSLSWDGRDYRLGNLMYIPSHANIKKGDKILTSGNSFIFPEDIPIGIVSFFEEDQGNKFYRIRLSFSNDFKNLHHVYVVENLHQEEQMELLNQSIPEDE